VNILVCLKQILDPEIPTRDFSVDPARREAVRGSHNLVLNVFCANALETALQFREKHGGTVAVLSSGPATAEDILRKALALKADDAALIVQDELVHPDPLAVARILAAGIRKRGAVDLVMVGRESGDWGHGQTGGLVAEELGWPCIGFVDQIEAVTAHNIRVRRQTDNGWEILEASLPLVLTITNNECNVPRIPKTRDVMQSFRKPLTKWTLADLGLTADQLRGDAYAEVLELFIPVKENACEFIAGNTLNESIAAFAERVREVVQSA